MLEKLFQAAEWCRAHSIILLVLGLVILPWIGWFQIAMTLLRENNGDHIGTLGDSFGALNALFSGLALAAVVIAITIQRQDLKATQESLDVSVRAHEETVQLMKREQVRKDFEGRRAATPALLVTDIASLDYKTSVTFALENVGQTIFEPRLRLCTSSSFEHSDVLSSPPVVLPKGARILVVVNAWPAADQEAARELAFFIDCLDSTGVDRTVKIAGRFAVGAALLQVEADFPTWQDEEKVADYTVF